MRVTVNRAIYSFAVLLGATCLAKVLSLALLPGAYARPDPVFGVVPLRYVLAGAAFLEYLAVWLLLVSGDVRLKLAAVAWLSTLFGLYRVGLWLRGTGQSCGCLGTVPEALGIPDRWVDAALVLALAYLGIASYGLLWRGVARGDVRAGSNQGA